MAKTNAQKRREEADRRHRAAEMRRAEQSRERRRRIITIAVSVVVGLGAVAGLTVGVLASRDGGGSDGSSIAGVQSFTFERGHTTEKVDYKEVPPAGGPHNPTWYNCGIYSTPLTKENAVHNLEHGTVWITYQPTLPGAQLDTIKKAVQGQTYINVSPYPNLPSPVVASAWGRQLKLDSADDPRLKEFISAFRLGKNAPEPGAPCTGGMGTPTG